MDGTANYRWPYRVRQEGGRPVIYVLFDNEWRDLNRMIAANTPRNGTSAKIEITIDHREIPQERP